MKLTVSGVNIDKFAEVNINLRYDSVASTFDVKLYFDPNNPKHKQIFMPGTYRNCEITHNGRKVLTGTILSHRFTDSSVKELTTISGYSITGILEDSRVNNSSLQFDKMSISEIASQVVTKGYGIKVVIDKSVEAICNQVFPSGQLRINATPETSVKEFLDTLLKQKNVILSHDRYGNLLFTSTKTIYTKPPVIQKIDNRLPSEEKKERVSDNARILQPSIYHFKEKTTWYNMSLSFDGQKMHGKIEILGQQDSSNAKTNTIYNPLVQSARNYVEVYSGARYVTHIQTAGTDNDTPLTVRRALGDEMKNLVVTIEVDRWEINGKFLEPNQIITITNPDIFIYNETRFFIREAQLFADNVKETATLTCVLPECYNDEPVINPFI